MSEDNDAVEWSEDGLTIRKAVLGADYVENSIKNADDFTMPLQEISTNFAWGWLWTREEHMPRKMRSLLNLAFLTALNRPHELEMHLRGALRNGVTKEEIREVFLQAAVYCGFPASVDAHRTAKKVFAEEGIE